MKILVVDVGGNHVKLLLSGQSQARRFDSGPELNPQKMMEGILEATKDWPFDAVSLGYPGPVLHGKPLLEPFNLGKGWVACDFAELFGKPVRIINDAAMQALGSYQGGHMLFLGLGTGLGTAMVVDGIIKPMELAHLPYKKATFEDYVGERGREKYGKKKWEQYVADVVERLRAALQPDEVVLGGGNTAKLKTLPPNVRLGANSNAFDGGFALWADTPSQAPASPKTASKTKPKKP